MFAWFPRRATDAEVAVARATLEGANGPTAELLLVPTWSLQNGQDRVTTETPGWERDAG